MYSASPTIGDWETFIADDLVAYVDSHYRTIANRMSRGLGGHSMGGYGTIRIGMKRPDVFSSLYIMSACCLMNAPFRGTGIAAPAARGEDARQAGEGQGRGRGGFGNVQAALAAAFSPNPNNPPDLLRHPDRRTASCSRWSSRSGRPTSPLAMIDQYVTNLKKYGAIMGEVGTQDGLAAANRQMDQIFTNFGISHTFETYDGDHTNRVVERIEQKVLPFFSKNLKR